MTDTELNDCCARADGWRRNCVGYWEHPRKSPLFKPCDYFTSPAQFKRMVVELIKAGHGQRLMMVILANLENPQVAIVLDWCKMKEIKNGCCVGQD